MRVKKHNINKTVQEKQTKPATDISEKNDSEQYYYLSDGSRFYSDFKNLWAQFRRTDKIPDKDIKRCMSTPIGDSIYPTEDKTKGRYAKKYNIVHYLFKYKFFYPALFIGKWFLGRHITDKIEKKWYNKNLIIFARSYYRALDIMTEYWNGGFNKQESYILPFKFGMTIAINDTATRELINVWCHELYKEMHEAYCDQEQVYHVFYSAKTSYDVNYFTLGKLLMEHVISPDQIQVVYDQGTTSDPMVMIKDLPDEHKPQINPQPSYVMPEIIIPVRFSKIKDKITAVWDVITGRAINIHVKQEYQPNVSK